VSKYRGKTFNHRHSGQSESDDPESSLVRHCEAVDYAEAIPFT